MWLLFLLFWSWQCARTKSTGRKSRSQRPTRVDRPAFPGWEGGWAKKNINTQVRKVSTCDMHVATTHGHTHTRMQERTRRSPLSKTRAEPGSAGAGRRTPTRARGGEVAAAEWTKARESKTAPAQPIGVARSRWLLHPLLFLLMAHFCSLGRRRPPSALGRHAAKTPLYCVGQ